MGQGPMGPGPGPGSQGPAASFVPVPGSWVPICIHTMYSYVSMCIHMYPCICFFSKGRLFWGGKTQGQNSGLAPSFPCFLQEFRSFYESFDLSTRVSPIAPSRRLRSFSKTSLLLEDFAPSRRQGPSCQARLEGSKIFRFCFCPTWDRYGINLGSTRGHFA